MAEGGLMPLFRSRALIKIQLMMRIFVQKTACLRALHNIPKEVYGYQRLGLRLNHPFIFNLNGDVISELKLSSD